MMKIIVAKFGGSSLADSNKFKMVKEIIKANEDRRFIVASAPGKISSTDSKITDLLYLCYDLANSKINYAEILELINNKYKEIVSNIGIDFDIDAHLKELDEQLQSGKSRDYIASRGEYLNAKILAAFLGFEFIDAKDLIFFDSKGNFLEEKSYEEIHKLRESGKKYVIPGFYGRDSRGEIKTFTRGGGDLTGSIISAGLKSDLYENWTDVSGFMTCDPKIVKNPKHIDVITYRELRELSYAGASILHEEAILPVSKAGIPVVIKNTFKPDDKGTMILPDETEHLENSLKGVTGIAGRKNFTVINIEKTKMNKDKGFHRKLMSVLEVNNVIIEHMPSSIDSVSLIIADKYLTGGMDSLISEIKTFLRPDKIKITKGIALISVVGRGMINHIGVSANLFNALAEEKINIQMIIQGSSEMNIIVGIDEKDFENAIRSIYQAFLN